MKKERDMCGAALLHCIPINRMKNINREEVSMS